MIPSPSTMIAATVETHRQSSTSSTFGKRAVSSFSIEALIAKDESTEADKKTRSNSVAVTSSSGSTSTVASDHCPSNRTIRGGTLYEHSSARGLLLQQTHRQSSTSRTTKVVERTNTAKDVANDQTSKYYEGVRVSPAPSSGDFRKHSSTSSSPPTVSPPTRKQQHQERRPSSDDDVELADAKRRRSASGSPWSQSDEVPDSPSPSAPRHQPPKRSSSQSSPLENGYGDGRGAVDTVSRSRGVRDSTSPRHSAAPTAVAADLAKFFGITAVAQNQQSFHHQLHSQSLPQQPHQHQLVPHVGQRPSNDAATADVVASLFLRQHQQRELHHQIQQQQQQQQQHHHQLQQQQQFCGTPTGSHPPHGGVAAPHHHHHPAMNHHQSSNPSSHLPTLHGAIAASPVRVLGQLPHLQPSPTSGSTNPGLPMHWPTSIGNHHPSAAGVTACGGPMMPALVAAGMGGPPSNVHRSMPGVGARDEFAPFYAWLLSRQGAYFNHRMPGVYGPDGPQGLLFPFRKPKRIRTAFSPSQLLQLEEAFGKNHYVVGQERKDLAASLSLTETQVKVWFQNRRTKHKRVQSDDASPTAEGSSPDGGHGHGESSDECDSLSGESRRRRRRAATATPIDNCMRTTSGVGSSDDEDDPDEDEDDIDEFVNVDDEDEWRRRIQLQQHHPSSYLDSFMQQPYQQQMIMMMKAAAAAANTIPDSAVVGPTDHDSHHRRSFGEYNSANDQYSAPRRDDDVVFGDQRRIIGDNVDNDDDDDEKADDNLERSRSKVVVDTGIINSDSDSFQSRLHHHNQQRQSLQIHLDALALIQQQKSAAVASAAVTSSTMMTSAQAAPATGTLVGGSAASVMRLH